MATPLPTPAGAAGAAADLYLGWVNASLTANERMARVARIWIDESLGMQQDLAETIRKAVGEARTAYTVEPADATPVAFATRAGGLARTTYFLFTENGLKAQERIGRVAQTAFAELQQVQTEITTRIEERMNGAARAAK